MDQIIICGNTCGHDHESANGPTGCCSEHGPFMYFCGECQGRTAVRTAPGQRGAGRGAEGVGERVTTETETQPAAVVKTARDLTEILRLYEALLVQAIHKAGAKIDGTSLPGGEPMVALAAVADPAEFAENVEAVEWRHLATCKLLDHTRCWTGSEDEDDSEPVLQTLLFWSEQWRTERGFPLDGRRPTVASEANVIRGLLDWAWETLPEWDDFADDIRGARLRLEDMLYAGARQEITRVVCPDCIQPPRLVHLYGIAQDGSDDRWKCPRCKVRLDADGVRRAHAKMLRSEGAEKWIPQVDAIGTLRAQGRPERTVRKWLADGEGSAYCDPITHEVWVWWPELWRKHLMTPTRRRGAGEAGETVA